MVRSFSGRLLSQELIPVSQRALNNGKLKHPRAASDVNSKEERTEELFYLPCIHLELQS